MAMRVPDWCSLHSLAELCFCESGESALLYRDWVVTAWRCRAAADSTACALSPATNDRNICTKERGETQFNLDQVVFTRLRECIM